MQENVKGKYPIKNISGGMKLRTDYIILSHVRNTFKKSTFINPSAIEGSYHYTWGMWQHYYYKELGYGENACHYFIEQLSNDYAVFKGLPEVKISFFLEELAAAYVIPYTYRNSMFICIGEDFSVADMEHRMLEHLSDKVLSDLMKRYKLNFDRIVYLDDILVEGWEQALEYSKLGYQITKQKFFDINILYFILNKYKKR
jgi:hypothetical protein